ncbi:MAG: oxygenase MpaB family protein, partial [Perlucidibaca sp.]
TLRVRLMHAFVRQSLMQRPDWRRQDWGLPIMQHDMVATQLEFSTVFIVGCAAKGLVFNRAEREAIMHYYRYVCWLMGVDEDLQPRNFREGLELSAMIMATSNQQPDEDGVALTRGLFGAFSESMAAQGAAPWFRRVMAYRSAALTRTVLGSSLSDRLQVPAVASRLPLLAGSAVIFAGDRLLGLLPATRKWRDRLGRQMFEQALRPQNHGFVPTMQGRPLVAVTAMAEGG